MCTPSSHSSPRLNAGVGVRRAAPIPRAGSSPRCRSARGRPRPCRAPCTRGGRLPVAGDHLVVRRGLRSPRPWGRPGYRYRPAADVADSEPRARRDGRPRLRLLPRGDVRADRRPARAPARTADVAHFYPCTNAAASAMVYTVEPREHLRAEMRRRGPRLGDPRRGAQPHPHRALPEPDRRAQAPDPGWHYVIVSLKRDAPGDPQLPDRRRRDHRGTDRRHLSLARVQSRRAPSAIDGRVRSRGARRACIHESVLDLVGNTPLVDISVLSPNPRVRILAKLEGQNPFGSVKDRIAKKMIEEAEKNGTLSPGQTILEPSSGNTGIALAAIAQLKGYPITIVMPDSVSIERRQMLEVFGASIILTPGPEGSNGAVAHARAARRRTPRVLLPLPVRQRRQPPRALRGHRAGDLARLPRDHPLRRRPRHERHADGHRPVPQGAEPRRSR